jgi:hypothetical protein
MGMRTKDIGITKDGVKTGPASGKEEGTSKPASGKEKGTSKGQISKLPLSIWGGREEIFEERK